MFIGLLLVVHGEFLDSGGTHQLGGLAVLADDESGSLLDGKLVHQIHMISHVHDLIAETGFLQFGLGDLAVGAGSGGEQVQAVFLLCFSYGISNRIIQGLIYSGRALAVREAAAFDLGVLDLDGLHREPPRQERATHCS